MRLDSHDLRDSILQAIAAAMADYTETVRALAPPAALDPDQLLRDLGGDGAVGFAARATSTAGSRTSSTTSTSSAATSRADPRSYRGRSH